MELMPCPFCGSTEVYTSDVRGSEPQGDVTLVECQDCFSRTAAWRTKKEAVEMWNTRPSTGVVGSDFLKAIADVRAHYSIDIFPEGTENSDRIGASMARRTCDNILARYRELVANKEG